MRKEQFLVLLGGFALVFLIYFFGKTKQPEAAKTRTASGQLDFDEYEALQISMLPSDDADRVRRLKSALVTRPGISRYKELSETWESFGNYSLGAIYFYEAAVFNSDSVSWEAAGDKIMSAYSVYGDSLISNNLLTFAVASFKNARQAAPRDLDIRMKLAETYVESPEPMKGIVILRELADSIPDYIPAQMRLGRLSLQTGQYERAIERFQNVLKLNPVDTEALYFLALSNQGAGNPEEAVRLLEVCKQLVDNPAFTQEINVYIDELKKEIAKK